MDIGRQLGYTGIPGLSTQIKNSYTRVILPFEHYQSEGARNQASKKETPSLRNGIVEAIAPGCAAACDSFGDGGGEGDGDGAGSGDGFGVGSGVGMRDDVRDGSDGGCDGTGVAPRLPAC